MRAPLPYLLLAAPLVSCLALPGSGARHDARAFHATTSFQGVAFGSDPGHLLLTSDRSGVFNVHELSIEDGSMTPLTRSTADAAILIDRLPGDERFLFSSDRGGNERTHVFVQAPGGEPLDLTPGDEVKATFVRWHQDRDSFFLLTNERDASAFDLYRVRFRGPAQEGESEIAPGFWRSLVLRNPGEYELSGVSADGVWVALTRAHSNADSDVYLMNTRRGSAEPVCVTPHEGQVEHGFAAFAPDGSRLFYSTDEGSEFSRIWSHDIASGKRAPVFTADWDVTGYAFSDDGRWLTTSVNADARTIVRVFDASSGREVVLPRTVPGDMRDVTFEHGGNRMACTIDSSTSPANVYLFDLARGEARRLTNALNPALDEEDLVEGVVVRYPSFDGLQIPAILYRPHQASPETPVPALVWVHGGPGGQSRLGYNATLQHLLSNGYAILAVNNRGSSGYGRTFFHLDDRRHGEVDLQDCVHGRRYLESLPWIDGRVGIIGGSYGGYMVCAALAFAPDAFDVGIDIFGVTNWVRTLESIPAWWGPARDSLYAELGDPAVDRVSLEARSPLVHARRIQKPLLVVQGRNDPRVLEVESREIVDAVRANGVPVDYLMFEDEGHGFRNKENRVRASRAFLEFLETHLPSVQE